MSLSRVVYYILVNLLTTDSGVSVCTHIDVVVDRLDSERAAQAWALCRDSWNSFLVLVNRAIVPKVGDKFPLVAAL